MPSKRLLNTRNTPVPPISSATVTGVPSNKVKALVVPFNVSVTGNVVVVPVGIASESRTVKYPTGWILRNPSAMSTVSVPTVTLVDGKYAIPPALVVILLKQAMLLPPFSQLLKT